MAARSAWLPAWPPRDRPGYRLRDGTVHARSLRGLLPDGSPLVAADLSPTMLAQLRAASRGHVPRGGPVAGGCRTAAPLRTASLDPVTAFNCVHHFDLARFLARRQHKCWHPAASCSSATPAPRSRTRARSGAATSPGFTEHEQRPHSQAALRDAVRRTDGLTMTATQTFQHPRTSTAGRLGAQARARHYSTFSFLHAAPELRASHRDLPGPPARPRGLLGWTSTMPVIAARSRHHQANPDGSGQRGGPKRDQGSGPPGSSAGRGHFRAPPQASRRPRADHPVMYQVSH